MKNYNIKDVAEKYIGQTEVKDNAGFNNSDFQKKMEVVGWRPSYQWCALFAELVWFEAFQGNKSFLKIIEKNFSPSAVKTFGNFAKIGMVSKTPVVGSVVVWQSFKKGVGQWHGHAGIVTKVEKDMFESVEGNTSDNGSREGTMVATRRRTYATSVYSGLAVLGYINPNEKEEVLPFKTKKEGDKFRQWVNDNYEEYARKIDLDASGSFKNKYILEAYNLLSREYDKS